MPDNGYLHSPITVISKYEYGIIVVPTKFKMDLQSILTKSLQ